MVYKKYYKRGRKYYKRAKQWANTPQTPKALALQALKGVRYIKGLVNSEMFHVNWASSVNISNTGGVLHLTALSQGDTATTRTGNSALFRNILQRCRITMSSSATTSYVRLMIVQDNQQVGDTSPTIADVLETVDVLAPLSNNTSGRFKILENRIITFDTAKTRTFLWNRYKKLYHHVRFNGPNNTDIQKGGIYFMYLSDQTTNTPTMDYNFKLGYRDN